MSEPTITDRSNRWNRRTMIRFGGQFDFEIEEITELIPSPESTKSPPPTTRNVQLPHSCDDWVIGEASDLAAFITEAQAVADWMAANPL